jgi:hypothetical protein
MDSQRLRDVQDEIIRAVQEQDLPHARRLVAATAQTGDQTTNLRELPGKEREACPNLYFLWRD